MGLIPKGQTPLIGVDISSTAVKLLQLSRSGNRFRVEYYAVEPLPPNAVVEKNIVEVEAVGEAIRRAVNRSGSKARHAAAAVAGSGVVTKGVPMPGELGENEMEAQVELEAVNYIPYPIEEVSLDFEVLGPIPNNPEMVQVLLAASRSENVELRQSALELGGLQQPWRNGGATPAEVSALAAFAADPKLHRVRASSHEVYDLIDPPSGAEVYFCAIDPAVGALTKYSLVKYGLDDRDGR